MHGERIWKTTLIFKIGNLWKKKTIGKWMRTFRKSASDHFKIIWAKAKPVGLNLKMNGYTPLTGIVWFLMNITTGHGETRRKTCLPIAIGKKNNPNNSKPKSMTWSWIHPTILMRTCCRLPPITTFIYRVRHSVPSIRASLLKSKFSTGRIPMSKKPKMRGKAKITRI